MYIPKQYREEDIPTLLAFMRANSFGLLVSISEGTPLATHVPMIVSEENGQVAISGHLAKANPHWQVLGRGISLAIFDGPHAYISPKYYEKRENVPTWDYIAVHAYGNVDILTPAESKAELEKILLRMMDTYDPDYRAQWEELSDRYRDGMTNSIIGFRMAVQRLEGKYKLSQNKTDAEQERIAKGLLESRQSLEAEVGEAILKRRKISRKSEAG